MSLRPKPARITATRPRPWKKGVALDFTPLLLEVEKMSKPNPAEARSRFRYLHYLAAFAASKTGQPVAISVEHHPSDGPTDTALAIARAQALGALHGKNTGWEPLTRKALDANFGA